MQQHAPGPGEAGRERGDLVDTVGRHVPLVDQPAHALDGALGGDLHALAFLVELVALKGRDRLTGDTVHSVLKY